MKITIIKKSNGKVVTGIRAACPWILDDSSATGKQ